MGRPDLHLSSAELTAGPEHQDGDGTGCVLYHLGRVSGIEMDPHTEWFRRVFWQRVFKPTMQVQPWIRDEIRARVLASLAAMDRAIVEEAETAARACSKELLMLGMRLRVDGRDPYLRSR